MSLTDYSHPIAKDIIKWLSTAKDTLVKGEGVVFFGTTQEGYDLAVLTARALILSGYIKLRCIDFNLCLEPQIISDIYQEKPPLLVLNFLPDSAYVSPELYKKLEALMNYYVDNCIPLLLHIPADENGPPADYGNLISPVFLDRIKKSNKRFNIT